MAGSVRDPGRGCLRNERGVDTPDVCFFSAAIAQTSTNLLFQLCKVCGGEAMFLGRELSDRGASHVAAFLGWWGFAMGTASRFRRAWRRRQKNRHRGVASSGQLDSYSLLLPFLSFHSAVLARTSHHGTSCCLPRFEWLVTVNRICCPTDLSTLPAI